MFTMSLRACATGLISSVGMHISGFYLLVLLLTAPSVVSDAVETHERRPAAELEHVSCRLQCWVSGTTRWTTTGFRASSSQALPTMPPSQKRIIMPLLSQPRIPRKMSIKRHPYARAWSPDAALLLARRDDENSGVLRPRHHGGSRNNIARNDVRTTLHSHVGRLALFKLRSSDDGADDGVHGTQSLSSLAAPSSSSAVLYFAYGANMNPSILEGKRGVKPLCSSVPAEAVAFISERRGRDFFRQQLPSVHHADDGIGVCMCFCHRAGFATLVAPPGPPQAWDVSPGAHGVLHVLSASGMERLEKAETGYRKRLLEVERFTGERVRAVCFVSDPMQMLPTSVPPTTRYLSLLRDGASHYGLNEEYQSWLACLPTVASKDSEVLVERTNTPAKALTRLVFAVMFVIASVTSAAYFGVDWV